MRINVYTSTPTGIFLVGARWKHPNSLSKNCIHCIFSVMGRDDTGGFRLYIKKKLFIMRVVRHCSRLPGEVMPHHWNCSSQVGQGFEKPDIVEDDPAHVMGSWTRWYLKVSSNPKHSVILWWLSIRLAPMCGVEGNPWALWECWQRG